MSSNEQVKDVMLRYNGGKHPLRYLCQEWIALLDQSAQVKDQLFGQYAREAMKFFDGNHNFMWQQEYAATQGGFLTADGYSTTGMPTFKMSHNRVFEAVALIGPALYHQNPNITVTPYTPPYLSPEELGLDQNDPMMQGQVSYLEQQQGVDARDDQVRAKLKQYFLNRLQQIGDKKSESQRAVDEAVIKGMGLMETYIYQPPHSQYRYPMSQYLSVDDYLQDPDAKYRRDRQWVAIRRVQNVHYVEQKFGFEPGTLRGNLQSVQASNTRNAKIEGGSNKRVAYSYDLLEYFEIYSKNGIGQRLKATNQQSKKSQINLDQFGEYCYLAVARDYPFPLNLPSSILQDGNADLFDRAQWAVPFWTECCGSGGWPVAELAFYNTPDHVWPISLIKPGIGELRFINWCMSFLADKVASSCTTYVATMKSLADELKQQLHGQSGPFKTLEIPLNQGAKSITDVISFLQAPDFNKDIWEMLTQVMEQFDKRVGLTELMYGLSAKQLRSAQEADIKNRNTTVRPDKMAGDVEDWASNVALKEIECAVFAMNKDEFIPFLGEVGAGVFEEKVLTQPIDQTVLQFDYRVEAGSAKKPNKEAKIDQLNQLGQVLTPVIMQFAMGGQIDPWNAFITDLAEAHDLDASRYLLQEAPQQPQQGPSPEDEMQMERERMDMESGAKQQELQMDSEAQQQKLALEQQSHAMAIQSKQQEMQLKLAEFQQRQAMAKEEFSQKSAERQADFEQRSQMRSQDLANEAMHMMQRQRLDEEKMRMQRQQSDAKVENSKTVAKATAKAKAQPKPKPKKKG